MIVGTIVVDDFEGFRRLVCSVLQQRAEFQVTEASNGLEAVQKAKELQPDLILLDIGLRDLSGLEVAKRVRKLAPAAKIIFISVESDPDVVSEALDLGASYIHKARLQSDLLTAIEAVLRGERFVSRDLGPNGRAEASHRHEVIFCSGDGVLLDALSRFIASALSAGDAAIVLVTQAHRDSLLQRLGTQDVDVDAAIQRGTLLLWDVRDALSKFMVNDWPDEVRFSTVLGSLIESTAKGTTGERHRVVTCGECAPTLWAVGKLEAAIRVEHLWNEAIRGHGVDTLCVYPSLRGLEDDLSFRLLCAEHTAVYTH